MYFDPSLTHCTVDVYAPGSSILSLAPNGGTRTLSGTSMAAPHACGMGAYLISLHNIPASQVCDRLKSSGLAVVRNPGSGTTNKLIYNGSGR